MSLFVANEIQLNEQVQRTAGIKARDDLLEIARGLGIQVLNIPIDNFDRRFSRGLVKLAQHRRAAGNWTSCLSRLNKSDVVVIQFPLVAHTVFACRIIESCHEKGIKVVLFVHDLETLRVVRRDDVPFSRKLRLRLEETNVLKVADCVIAHNDSMADVLCLQFGVDRSSVVSLEIFDYLVEGIDDEGRSGRFDPSLPLVISGNLRSHKAAYAYRLPEGVPFNLYGVGYEGSLGERVRYFGSFPPDELPRVVSGSFGVVWDGDSCDTCSGVYGEYLKVNNPHKASCYLAMGLPVVIWDQAALAHFVYENGLGIVAPTLEEAYARARVMSRVDYSRMRENVLAMSRKLRSGWHTKRALAEALSRLGYAEEAAALAAKAEEALGTVRL